MFRVYIPSGNFHIERQLPASVKHIISNCEFVFDDNEDYDYFVTIDNIEAECLCKVDKQHRLLFLGEPPFIKQYNEGFISQYGHVYSCQKKRIKKGLAKRHFPLLAWMLGVSLKENSHSTISNLPFLTYDDFAKMKDNEKRLNKCCLITSNKKMTKGHRDRVRFADYVLKRYSDIIDVYGNGYKSIPDKLEVLKKYKYAIVIENCCYPDYWTEKIGDCYLAGCYPIYHGCSNIEEYFPHEAFTSINVSKMEEAVVTIKHLLHTTKFEESKQALQSAKDLVLDEYNIFPQLAKAIEEIEKNQSMRSKCEQKETLYPMRLSITDKVKQMIAWKLNFIV